MTMPSLNNMKAEEPWHSNWKSKAYSGRSRVPTSELWRPASDFRRGLAPSYFPLDFRTIRYCYLQNTTETESSFNVYKLLSTTLSKWVSIDWDKLDWLGIIFQLHCQIYFIQIIEKILRCTSYFQLSSRGIPFSIQENLLKIIHQNEITNKGKRGGEKG